MASRSPLTRRRLLAMSGGALGVLLLPGCGSDDDGNGNASGNGTSSTTTSTTIPPLTEMEGVLGWIRTHSGSVSLLVDDGDNDPITYRADARQPVASAVKVVHLAAYALAVVAGSLDPNREVPVADWDRFYLPNVDGGNHNRALEALGVDPAGTVKLDDIVRVMIELSDNAAADMLRDLLGDDALRAALAEAGVTDGPELPTFLGEALLVATPPEGDRRRAAEAAALRYTSDETYRAAEAGRPPFEDVDRLLRWAAGGPTGTAEHLVAVHRAIATDELGSPEASAIARTHLERVLADRLPRGTLGFGAKNGLLPGVYVDAASVRWEDGRVGVGAICMKDVDVEGWTMLLESGTPTLLLQQALVDPDVHAELAAAV